jgi:ABC-type multidrug transport system ATPase subunit
MIVIKDLHKQYGDIIALQKVNLSIGKGELFGLIGPDGAGKSSLMRILMSLYLPDKGTASMNGFDVVKDYRKIRMITGYMPGKFSLYPDLTVEENLNFFAAVFGTTVNQNYDLIREIYVQIEPFKTRRASKLSGGMKQKLALCCALIHKPDILVLDEPTTGVDAVSRKEFWEMLKRLKKLDITILVSTPYMDEASLCDRIALMQQGKILAVDTPAALTQSFAQDLWSIYSEKIYTTAQILAKLPFLLSVNSFGQVLHLITKKGEHTIQSIQNFLSDNSDSNTSVERCAATVEDVFILLMNDKNAKTI